MKKQIEKERNEVRSFKKDANAFRNKRSEMEDIFLQCIEQVRRDISKRKAV